MTGFVRHQLRYDVRRFFRDPQAVVFTMALPIIFLVVFAAVFGNERLDARDGLRIATYYVPGIMALGVMSAAFVSLAIGLVEARERGSLKRVRATPMPAAAFIVSRALTAVLLTALTSAALVLVGWALYDVTAPTSRAPGLLLTLAIGTVCFCCLGFALAGIVHSASSAPAVANLVMLPLQMISGIFFPVDQIPDAVLAVAKAFPVYWLAQGLLDAFDPNGPAGAVNPTALAVLVAWGAVGLLVAVRTFRWEPQGD
jgi:ABC-2 type transport system permease protein